LKTFFNKILKKPKTENTSSRKNNFSNQKESVYKKVVEEEDDEIRFIRLYNESGGKFLYSDSQNELLNFLKEIHRENDFCTFWCIRPKLQYYLEQLNIQYKTVPARHNQINLINCEYLISFNGSVMISSNQTDRRKLNELSNTFVVVAYTDQIVKNISEGLSKIKSLSKKNIPTNITTIKGLKNNGQLNSSDARNIYLLLIERTTC